MAEGSIKWYDDKKGFGFIEREDQDDIWFHARDRAPGTDEARFVPGTRVEFTEEVSRGREKACITRILDEAGPAAEPEPGDVPQYTLDEIIVGLEQAFLAGLEWLDLLKQAGKNGRA